MHIKSSHLLTKAVRCNYCSDRAFSRANRESFPTDKHFDTHLDCMELNIQRTASGTSFGSKLSF